MPLASTSKLFSAYEIKGETFKNRLAMAPMCMYSVVNEDGIATDFHHLHYASCALGEVGLIIQEATAVVPEGRISSRDLGIWDDSHVPPLKALVAQVHRYGAKMGVQLAHAGRKAELASSYAPSALAFSDDRKYSTPIAMTLQDIRYVVAAFQDATIRAKEAGYDVIEIHGAHGYLINQFLSPLTNQRADDYGGSKENQFRILREIIQAVREEWQGPLFVRISAEEYGAGGYGPEDYIEYCQWMKDLGVDLIDVSSGGIVPISPKVSPGYQVPYAAAIKKAVAMPTSAVGLILEAQQAEQILQDEAADLVMLGRPLLRNPNCLLQWGLDLGRPYQGPFQYERGFL